ncbi:hypothetical protein RGQ13_15345 [Thalassotalea psychrophila]|uniref:Uncharacterized protein n=1 Tax=Thalassotalea psychrophila TaxID=3065647 RepID=A0ABY9TTC2_9GAMM|nr:hypothetical protein RGQ13_12780 [Colwelliaceae bacterium SQ149]WNC71486.1 hypothetical protein RGQ13_15345 [Colwelliaceae bacterium SQ149]
MQINLPIFKFSLVIFAAIVVLLIFIVALTKATTGDQRTIIEPDIIIDYLYTENQQCDCWYRAEGGDVSGFSEGLGCNILVMDKVDRDNLPECTYKVWKDNSKLN